MASTDSLSTRSVSPRASRSALLIAFIVTSALASASLSAAPETTAATPPDFPDAAHVENGCYLSTFVYLAKFLAAHPGERGEPLTVQSRNYDEPHTIALVSWRGRWWGRDEYCGVFAIDCAVETGIQAESLKTVAEAALQRRAARLLKQGRIVIPSSNARRLTADRRAQAVATARTLLPAGGTPFWVQDKGSEVPLLFFRPAPGQIAVYDPVLGTATAETTLTDPARIVALVAARLGYRNEPVEREKMSIPTVLLAANETAKGGVGR